MMQQDYPKKRIDLLIHNNVCTICYDLKDGA